MTPEASGILFLTTMFLLAFIGLLVVLFLRQKEQKRSKAAREALEAELRESALKAQELERQNQRLAKYEHIVDAEAAAAALRASAQEEATQLLQAAHAEKDGLLTQARQEAVDAKREAKETLTAAKADAKASREKAESALASATAEAAKIVEIANGQAKEIAGEAYEAMKNSDRFEQTAKAMKNVIEGYGDRYLIPSYTLIDNLAEEFGFTEGGAELKSARDRMRLMIQNGTAATCEYVEANRKETAINFVLDAFNGKVDSILSGLKQDNHGTLAQKIKDAFRLVNHLGAAFRNAAITKEFLAARLQELHWLAVVQELKVKEREEQREIKERMREEEKARCDFERAQKEAEKEEYLLMKAIEKVQSQVEQASAEQKAQFEAQLQELALKLQAAEEKNMRALSMAQQTKTGHIYVISNIGSFGEDVFKIGMTRRLDPLDRVRELGDASVPFEFDVHALILSEDAPALEHKLHKRFLQMQMNKVNPRKEFFRVGIADIRNEIEQQGIEAHWTMAAEAKQYRESLAIEVALRTDAHAKAEWEKHQNEMEEMELEEVVPVEE